MVPKSLQAWHKKACRDGMEKLAGAQIHLKESERRRERLWMG